MKALMYDTILKTDKKKPKQINDISGRI